MIAAQHVLHPWPLGLHLFSSQGLPSRDRLFEGKIHRQSRWKKKQPMIRQQKNARTLSDDLPDVPVVSGELPVLLVEKLTIQEINGKTMKMLKTFQEKGTLGLGSVVRISPIYQPFMSHLEGVTQPDPQGTTAIAMVINLAWWNPSPLRLRNRMSYHFSDDFTQKNWISKELKKEIN